MMIAFPRLAKGHFERVSQSKGSHHVPRADKLAKVKKLTAFLVVLEVDVEEKIRKSPSARQALGQSGKALTI